jgi:hypothetical protein
MYNQSFSFFTRSFFPFFTAGVTSMFNRILHQVDKGRL